MRWRIDIFFVLIVVAGCATSLGASPEGLRGRVEWEEAGLLKRVKVYDEPGLTEYLVGIVGRVSPTSSVVVIEDPTLAAFAMPGGRVFVHTGLVSAVGDEGQLAMVLAREVARAASRHGTRASRVPMATVALSPTAAALFGLDLRLAIGAAVEGYGRDVERAADAEALRRLAAAGYDPGEAARVFRRLASDAADRGGLAEIFVYGAGRRLGERDQTVRGLLDAGAPARTTGQAPSAGEFARRTRGLVRENARLDFRAGRFALARRQLDRVLAADPADPIAQLYDGEWYRLHAQRAEGPARTESARHAIERYRRALELDPRSAAPLRQLALLHYQQGDVVEARAAFARYLTVEPNAPDAPRIRQYFETLGRE